MALSSLRATASQAQQWLDTRLFPRVIAYTTHHLHIVALMLLWVGLLVGGAFTAFELVGGNYTNGLSALAGCIIMLLQQKHQRENHARHDAHAQQMADLHAKVDALAAKPARKAAQKGEA